MFNEFKTFIMRGNVIDLAVGIIIGAAFTAIVDSMVKDVLMPPIGFMLGGVDFSNFFLVISGERLDTLEETRKAGAVVIAYGAFINAVIKFMIVALAVFLLVKTINRLRDLAIRKEAAAAAAAVAAAVPAEPPRQEMLLEQIRDLLAKRA